MQLLASLLPFALLTGCAMGDLNLSGPDNSPTKVAVHITGTVHGGQQPVSGSTIQLYQTGTTGYGSLATALIIPGGVGSVAITNGGAGYTSTPTVTFSGGGATTQATATAGLGNCTTTPVTCSVVSLTLNSNGAGYTSAPTITFSGGTPTITATAAATFVPTGGVVTDANGNFSITGEYTCPFPSSAMVYITAMNGNPGLSGTNVSNGAIRLIEPLGPCSGLSNATTVAINEVTTAATAFAMGQYFTTSYGGTSIDSFGAPNTTQAQLGIANAYATYLNLVTPNGFANTGSTVTNAIGSIAITPEASKLYTIADILAACVNTTSAGSTQCATLFADVTPTNPPGTTTGTAKLPTDVLQAAVYMSLNPTSINAAGSSANLTALYGLQTGTASPYPGLGAQPTDWTLGITYGSTSPASGGGYIMGGPENLAIDSGGNVWIANYSGTNGSLLELSPNGTPLTLALNNATTPYIAYPIGLVIDPSNDVFVSDYGTSSTLNTKVAEYTAGGATKTFVTGAGPGNMVSDASGDIFVIDTSATGGGANLVEIPAGAASGTLATSIGALTASKYSGIAMDQYYNIWVGNGGATTNPTYITPFVYSAPGGTPTWTLGTAATTGCMVSPEGEAVDSNGNLWFPNYVSGAGTLCEVTSSSSGTVSGPATGYTGGGMNNLGHMIVDGGNNLWVSNQGTTTEGVSEFTNAGVALSPTSGGFAHNFDEPYYIAIDPSGNVWVGNYKITGSATTAGYITEIVGAAVPTVTPIAAGLPATSGGTMRIGTRP